MVITWLGQSCFKIEGEKSVLVIDPFDTEIGLKLPRLTADVVTVSHDHKDHNNTDAIKGVSSDRPYIINAPGEYEVKNIFVYGIPSFHDDKKGAERGKNIIFRYEIDGIKFAHLGDLGHLLENGQIEKLEGLDILMIPVGGTYTIDGKQANELISQLEPRVVIPMHYHVPGSKSKLAGLDTFCKEIGICPKEALPKYKIAKKDLPQDELQVVVLEP